ncbi:glutamic-type intramembrane protease PrsW [Paenibacillus marinisediminis]
MNLAVQVTSATTPIIALLTAAVAPGIALLIYFYLKDKYAAEPISMVLRVFLVGFLIVFPIMIIQHGLTMWWGSNRLMYSFVISSGVEEAVKWFVLYHMIYNHVEFDEHYDGILYAVAVSLGFATIENVMYALSNNSSFGFLLSRALLPVSGHALFGILMGYYMGKAKFTNDNTSKKYLAISLIVPIFWHGVYDMIMTSFTRYWIWAAVPLMVSLWYFGMAMVRRANLRSPFRMLKHDEEHDNGWRNDRNRAQASSASKQIASEEINP